MRPLPECLLVVAAEVPAQTFAGPLAAGTPNGFAVRRGTNVSHWLSQSRRRGDERRGFFTREDVALAAKLGFDHLRIPVDEEQLFDESGRPIEEAFALLDAALDWCAEHRLRAIDGDPLPDLAVVNRRTAVPAAGPDVSFLRGNGNGSFGGPTAHPVGEDPSGLAIAVQLIRP